MASSPWGVKFLVPKGSGKNTNDPEFCFSLFLSYVCMCKWARNTFPGQLALK